MPAEASSGMQLIEGKDGFSQRTGAHRDSVNPKP